MAKRSKARQTVKEHLKELRNRLFACVGVFIFFAIAIYFVYEPIIEVLNSNLGSDFYYSDPAGGFSFVMRICTTGAIIFSIPVVVYNSIRFIKPAFEKILTTKRIILASIFSTLFAISGALFAYYLILPESLRFFSEFNVSGLNALIGADEFLSFIINMIVIFALVFQVPLLMLLADSIKKIPPKSLIKHESTVLIISVIISILTPFNYDLLSSLVIALPIVGLYNLSIVLIISKHFIETRRNLGINKYQIIKPAQINDFNLTNAQYEIIKQDIVSIQNDDQPFIIPKTKPIVMDFKAKTIKNMQQDIRNKRHNTLGPIHQNIRSKAFFDIIPSKTSHA